MQTVEKKNKPKLLRSLLEFARPYIKSLVVALFFVLISTLLELLNPYLVKIAIDNYISGDNIPMVEVSTKDDKTIEVGSHLYKRLTDIEQETQAEKEVYTIETEDGKRYLVRDSQRIEVIDDEIYKLFRNKDIEAVTKISLFYIIAVFSNFLATWCFNFILGKTGSNIIYDIRKKLFAHLLKQSNAYYNKTPVGKLMTRVTSDTQQLSEFYANVLVSFIADLGIVVGVMVLMIKLNTKLALMCFTLIPFIIAISIYFRNKQFKLFRSARTKLAIINTVLNEYLSGMSIIRIFGKEKKMDTKFSDKNHDYMDTRLRQIKNHAFFRPSIELLRSLGEAFLIYYGGGLAIQNKIEFGTLFLFITYLKRFFMPIMDMAEKYNIMQLALASVEKIVNILNEDTEIKALPEYANIKTDSKEGEIEFKNVDFSYVPGEKVLKNISFKIKKGESVAFVGATGAGKTSILSLLARLYDIDSGNIFVDGKDIRSMSTDQLRRKLGFVLQDVFLFSGDIKYNITLGENYKDSEIIDAAKKVRADNFIKKLPSGYDTEVKERGSTLSTGERQLLSFARTILRNPEILILDEATASIDTETEILIQEGIKELMHNRTSIAIAHRLSTISGVDRIYVMQKGQIVEIGNHEELMAKKGYYYKLYKLQVDK